VKNRRVLVRIVESVYYDVEVEIPDGRATVEYLDALATADCLGDLVDPTQANVTTRTWEPIGEPPWPAAQPR
jgi:hypothetical protein